MPLHVSVSIDSSSDEAATDSGCMSLVFVLLSIKTSCEAVFECCLKVITSLLLHAPDSCGKRVKYNCYFDHY